MSMDSMNSSWLVTDNPHYKSPTLLAQCEVVSMFYPLFRHRLVPDSKWRCCSKYIDSQHWHGTAYDTSIHNLIEHKVYNGSNYQSTNANYLYICMLVCRFDGQTFSRKLDRAMRLICVLPRKGDRSLDEALPLVVSIWTFLLLDWEPRCV